MHVFNRLSGSRIVAKPAALDAITWPEGSIALRFAADELYITPALDSADLVLAQDEHAIVISEGAFSGAWVEEHEALHLLERLCEWPIPAERPMFTQGSVAGIATKLWLTDGSVLFLVASPYAHELEERLA